MWGDILADMFPEKEWVCRAPAEAGTRERASRWEVPGSPSARGAGAVEDRWADQAPCTACLFQGLALSSSLI